MKSVRIAVLGSMLAALLSGTGCGRTQKGIESAKEPKGSVQQGAQNADSDGSDGQEEIQEDALSRFDDAKTYCMGMLLYAQKNQNLFPTDLDLTLPYLREASHIPSGTNRFEILYNGSYLQLTNSTSIVIRSEPWQRKNRNWTRIYGFADGHCEVHSEPDGNFNAWEKRHSSPRKPHPWCQDPCGESQRMHGGIGVVGLDVEDATTTIV